MQIWEARGARADAMLKLDDGDVPGARSALDSLIDALTDAGAAMRPELAQAHIDRATVERLANDWGAALSDLDTAESIAGQLGFFPRQAVLTNLDNLRARIHSTSYAAVFDLALAQSAVDRLSATWSGHWMVDELESHIAFQRRDWDRAATKALHAASLLAAEGWARGTAACRRRAGDALLESGRLDEAGEQLTTAFDFFHKHGPPDLLSETRLALARLESLRLHHDTAWTMAGEALSEVESRVRRFVDLAQQQRFLLDKLRFYDFAFDIALAAGGTTGWYRAWTVAERSKSFYLAHLLANADVPLFDGVDPQLVTALEALESQLDACEQKLELLPAAQRGGTAELELETRLRDLSEERRLRLQTIMERNPRWVRLRNPEPFDASRLAGTLPQSVVPLGFYWRQSSSGATLHVFARTAAGVPLHDQVNWTTAQLDELARYAERLHGAVDEYADLLPEGITDRILPPAVRDALTEGACLLISPHGRLRGLPLHALPLDDSIVLARWPMQYVPSLALPQPAHGVEQRAVLLMGSSGNAFGDPPLPDVELELAALEKLWRAASTDVVMRMIAADAAPEDAGWPPATWSKFGVLHFACHGRFFENRPLDGGLRLGRDVVRGSELFATKLNATVVALSACALGQRAERVGNTEVVSEERVGLYLPLFYAGARSLVVSLWDAHSQTARQFMADLHQQLAEGVEPHLAFQAALLRVRRKLPARWANWCLVGLPQ